MAQPEIDARVDALAAKVNRLEAKIETLTNALEAQRSQRDSMRGQLKCPACGGRRIYRAKKVLDRDSGQQYPMAVSMTGLFFPKAHGVFQCDVCASCGLVEWYVSDPKAINLEQDDIELIEIDDQQPGGPYR